MAIESIEPVGHGVRPQQESVGEGAPAGERVDEFASTLDAASGQGQTAAGEAATGVQAVGETTTIAAPASVETAQPATTVEPADAPGPTSAAEILTRIGDGHARLEALIEQVRSGQSYTVQELLGLQAEVYKLTLELEATTTLVTEGVRATNRLFQQQI